MINKILSSLKVIALATALSFGLSYVYAWTAPTVAPTGGNVSAPINTSGTAQTKSGDLNVSGKFTVSGDTIVAHGKQIFDDPTKNGTPANEFTVPATVTKVWVTGVGGGGSGGALNSHGSAGGGGGGEARVVPIEIPVVPGSKIAVTVGAGGPSVSTATTNGNPGIDSTFGTQIIAKGGGGGGYAYYNAGGTLIAGYGGLKGGPGGNDGASGTAVIGSIGGRGGDTNAGVGGSGGVGYAVSPYVSYNGYPGSGYGSGGGGAGTGPYFCINCLLSRGSGAGASGVVVVEW